MGRKKISTDISDDNYGVNPFAEGLEIEVSKKRRQVKNIYDKLDWDENTYEVDVYAKFFDIKGSRAKADNLNMRAKEMLLYIMQHLQPSKDYIFINRENYKKIMSIKSNHTYLDAERDLTSHGYIYKHTNIKGLYWINPRYIFKGSRINKFPDNVIVTRINDKKVDEHGE